MTWVDFKRTFTQEQEDALWQYLMDHSRVEVNGYYGVQLYFRDKDDFWNRVHSRATGEFIRYDVEKKEILALRKKKKWEKHWEKYSTYKRIATHPLINFIAKLLWIH